MPDFFWRAAGADGKVVTGQLDAPNEAAVLKQLRSKGLTPLAVQDAASAATSGMATAANASAAAAASAGFKQPRRGWTKARSNPRMCWHSPRS